MRCSLDHGYEAHDGDMFGMERGVFRGEARSVSQEVFLRGLGGLSGPGGPGGNLCVLLFCCILSFISLALRVSTDEEDSYNVTDDHLAFIYFKKDLLGVYILDFCILGCFPKDRESHTDMLSF